MLIPRRFRLRRKTFIVHSARANEPVRGRTFPKRRTLYVHTHDVYGNSYTPEQRSETFWHELTHAILHEMKHPQWNDEVFVTKFAKLLDEAVRTADITHHL